MQRKSFKNYGPGILLALLVHVGFGVTLASTRATPEPDKEDEKVILCDGMRCPMLEDVAPWRPVEWMNQETVLEAMVVPRLGHAKPTKKKLPRHYKYEQPKKHEVSVNVTKKNKVTKKLKKAPKTKKAQVDKRRKKSKDLASLLNAPEENDPRKRAAKLDKIVGLNSGSVYGRGTEKKAGDPYVAKVKIAIERRFPRPQSMTKKQLRLLKVVVRIQAIAPNGTIRSYRIIRKSGNRLYDNAALAAIKKFVPKEGGTARLPKPSAADLARIHGHPIDMTLRPR